MLFNKKIKIKLDLMNSMGIGRKKTVVLRKTFFTFFFYSVNVNDVKEYIAGKHLENPTWQAV